MSTTIFANRLPIKELAKLVRDLQTPRPAIYWVDLGCCLLVSRFGLYLAAPFPHAFIANPLPSITGFMLAVLALYRASYFNHELAHHARHLRGLELAWNLAFGVPLLSPSFLYSDHRNHHSKHGFATDGDAEYIPARMRNTGGAVALFALAFVMPIVHVIRFAVIVPAAWLSPGLRQWADTHASTIGGPFGLLGHRAPPTARELPKWRLLETACCCYLFGIAAAMHAGVLPIERVIEFYAATASALVLHSVRLMVGHRYEADGHGEGNDAQVLDSFNFTRNGLLTLLLLPVGFDMHALHHLFPAIPYHNLPEAHRRIAAALPKDSIYHAVESKSFLVEVARFLAHVPRPAAISP